MHFWPGAVEKLLQLVSSPIIFHFSSTNIPHKKSWYSMTRGKKNPNSVFVSHEQAFFLFLQRTILVNRNFDDITTQKAKPYWYNQIHLDGIEFSSNTLPTRGGRGRAHTHRLFPLRWEHIYLVSCEKSNTVSWLKVPQPTGLVRRGSG